MPFILGKAMEIEHESLVHVLFRIGFVMIHVWTWHIKLMLIFGHIWLVFIDQQSVPNHIGLEKINVSILLLGT